MVFLTFSIGDDSYHDFATQTVNSAINQGYDTFVLTDKPDLYPNSKTLLYEKEKFSYHDKLDAVEWVYSMGYKQILYLDADIIVNDIVFFNDVKKIEFNDGINYTRSGIPKDLESHLNEKHLSNYRTKLDENFKLNYSEIPSIFEDIFVFNFEKVDPSQFFKYFKKLRDLKHESDIQTDNQRYGDQEGYSISIASKLSLMPCQISDSLRTLSSTHLLASNYTYDGIIKSIMAEVSFIFPYRKDSIEREQNFSTCLNYYKRYFNDSEFIISEQGEKRTIFHHSGYNYTFEELPLPHNQSRTINQGIRLSDKKIVCVIDSDIILINHYNIYLAVKEIFQNKIDYCLPYLECVDLPGFMFRGPWGGYCIGGIYVVDRNKFIEIGLNDEEYRGWGREDDDRHQRMLDNGFRFKRHHGNIVHMYHPPQENIKESAEKNLIRLRNYTDGNGNTNEVQKDKLI